jgi:tRNA(His) 5'-end guanylyltransferase
MPQRKSANANQSYPQRPYDSALKGLMSDHAAEIIANLLPGTVLISEENSEIAGWYNSHVHFSAGNARCERGTAVASR